MKCTILWENEDHRWLFFADDPERPDSVIDTNQVVISSGDAAILLDPGGIEVFPSVVAAISQEIDLSTIKHLFLSHQDPDVASSLPLWRQVCGEDLSVHVSWMWAGFVSHFDRDATFANLPDPGAEIVLSPKVHLKALPAHYLHSPGCFCIWDPAAKALFTGDIGAALLPRDHGGGVFVTDFGQHVSCMEGFHKRWLGSGEARDKWVAMVRRLEPDLLVPQHGRVFKGADVGRFLDWLADLPLGAGLEAYDRALVGL